MLAADYIFFNGILAGILLVQIWIRAKNIKEAHTICKNLKEIAQKYKDHAAEMDGKKKEAEVLMETAQGLFDTAKKEILKMQNPDDLHDLKDNAERLKKLN